MNALTRLRFDDVQMEKYARLKEMQSQQYDAAAKAAAEYKAQIEAAITAILALRYTDTFGR